MREEDVEIILQNARETVGYLKRKCKEVIPNQEGIFEDRVKAVQWLIDEYSRHPQGLKPLDKQKLLAFLIEHKITDMTTKNNTVLSVYDIDQFDLSDAICANFSSTPQAEQQNACNNYSGQPIHVPQVATPQSDNEFIIAGICPSCHQELNKKEDVHKCKCRNDGAMTVRIKNEIPYCPRCGGITWPRKADLPSEEELKSIIEKTKEDSEPCGCYEGDLHNYWPDYRDNLAKAIRERLVK